MSAPLDRDGLDGILVASRATGETRDAQAPAPRPPAPPPDDTTELWLPPAAPSPPPRAASSLVVTAPVPPRPQKASIVRAMLIGLAAGTALVVVVTLAVRGWPGGDTANPAAQTHAPETSEANAAPPAAPLAAASRTPLPAPPPAVTSPLRADFPASFSFNAIAPEAIPPRALARLVDDLQQCSGSIVLVGHSCGQGDTFANHETGLHRAAQVKAVLVREGIDPARIHTATAGSSEPRATNATPQGRSLNRRVTVTCAVPVPENAPPKER